MDLKEMDGGELAALNGFVEVGVDSRGIGVYRD